MTNRTPPFQYNGVGVLEYFNGGGKIFEHIPFKHFCSVRETALVIDGVQFATWTPGNGVIARFATDNDDDDQTTEEIANSNYEMIVNSDGEILSE